MNTLSNHTTRWTAEELDFLTSSWDGTDQTLAAVAELLERTVEACRQRYYEWTWGKATAVVAKPDPATATHHTAGAVHRRRQEVERKPGKVCTLCWVELPLTGGCPDCED